MCHIFLTARVIYLWREFSGIYGLWPPLLALLNVIKKNFFYLNIIKFEHISSFFFCHWNFPRKAIGSPSWMMMKFRSADVLFIFKSLLKSLTQNTFKSNVLLQEPVSPALSSCRGRIVKGNPRSHLSIWSAFSTSSLLQILGVRNWPHCTKDFVILFPLAQLVKVNSFHFW